MAIFLRDEKNSSIWVVFTDLMAGLFTVFVFAFLVVWLLKEQSERDLVERNEAFTRKEQEYQTCVDEKKLAQEKLVSYQAVLGEHLRVPIEQGLLALADDGKIDIQAHLLFPSGYSRLTPEGETILRSVTQALLRVARADSSFIIMVAGHTDNIPVHSSYFRSNWELSAMRAQNAVREMLAQDFPPERIFAAGFGEHQPKAPNENEQQRELNRRVEIVRLNRFDGEQR